MSFPEEPPGQEYTDSHAHPGMCGDPDTVIRQALDNSVRIILSVGSDLKSSDKAVDLACRFDQVYASVGVHPHDASYVSEETVSSLATLAENAKTRAIGETGIDLYRNRAPVRDQVLSFRKHIELARESGLALIVHARNATAETLEILEKHAEGLKVILHCFSMYDRVEECADRQYFMSVAGNITFRNAHLLREAAIRIPDNLLLTETDSPYLTPVPFRGKANRPENVRYVLEELALLRGVNITQMASVVLKNLYRALGI